MLLISKHIVKLYDHRDISYYISKISCTSFLFNVYFYFCFLLLDLRNLQNIQKKNSHKVFVKPVLNNNIK